MKKILRYILLFIFVLIAHQYFWQNLTFNFQLDTLLKVAAILTVFELILKPIIKIIALPINLLTLGIFRLVIDTLGLYLCTFLLDSFILGPIYKPSSVIFGFTILTINLTGFFSYLATSLSLSFMLYIFNKLLIKKQKI